MATTLLQNSLSPEDADVVYDSLLQRIRDNGYRIAGSYREIFHQLETEGKAKPLVEIQFPIKQAG